MIIFGSNQFGKVDQIPGLFHVETTFFHIQYIPLIPFESHLVIEDTQTDGRFRDCRIPLSGKSIAFAWGRTALLIGGCILAVLGFFELVSMQMGNGQPLHFFTFLGTAVMSFAFFWLSF